MPGLHPCIKFVGTDSTFPEETLLDLKGIPPAELTDALNRFVAQSSIHELIFFPNKQFSDLTGPKGYVAALRDSETFSADMFLHDPFRVISAIEINFNAAAWNSPGYSEKAREYLKKCLPTEALVPPDVVMDTKATGWGPCLSPRDSFVGIRQVRHDDRETNSTVSRYFLICQTSLPDETLERLAEELYEAQAEELTFRSVFRGERAIMPRALELARENARRILWLTTEILSLIPRQGPAVPWAPTPAPGAYSEGGVFRTSEALRERLASFLGGKKPAEAAVVHGRLLARALEWWPKELPIYPFSTITGGGVASDLEGFPLGFALHQLRASSIEGFNEVAGKFRVIFQDVPKRVEPTIETDFNTFRYTEFDTLVWYNGCTSVKGAGSGVLIPQALAIGVEVVNTPLLNPLVYQEWTNSYYNAYPVFHPYLPERQSEAPNFENLQYFFDMNSDGKTPPRALLGFRKVTDSPQLDQELKKPSARQGSFLATPVLTYCSPHLSHIPAREFAHILT